VGHQFPEEAMRLVLVADAGVSTFMFVTVRTADGKEAG
jgi:hypothetical protein